MMYFVALVLIRATGWYIRLFSASVLLLSVFLVLKTVYASFFWICERSSNRRCDIMAVVKIIFPSLARMISFTIIDSARIIL